MHSDLKVLGQQPVKASLAGVEVSIYPPTIYRLQQILDAVLEVLPTFEIFRTKEIAELLSRKESTDEDDQRIKQTLKDFMFQFTEKSAMALCLMCKDEDGTLPPRLTDDDFWSNQVTTSAIADLVGIFVDLIDLDKLLKKVSPLTGMALSGRSPGQT